MKHQVVLTGSLAALFIIAGPSHADSTGFIGAYGPATWTIPGAGLGGSSATFAPDGSELELIGSDGGIGSDIDVTHAVIVAGMWSFDWLYTTVDTKACFDAGYYLHNGEATFLSCAAPD